MSLYSDKKTKNVYNKQDIVSIDENRNQLDFINYYKEFQSYLFKKFTN